VEPADGTEVQMTKPNQHPSQPFITPGRALAIVALYVVLAVLPQNPIERPLFMARLLLSSPPTEVAVPVAHVTRDSLRDSWGNPRGGGRHHEGIDIFAPRGTPVLASTDGMVWRVGTDGLGGRVVWILGPGRQLHYYAHLDAYADLRSGDPVSVGDRLGIVGTTGNARGGPPHLHYGIYADGGALNPYPLLAPALSRKPDTRTRARVAAAGPRRSLADRS
jgi:peptidoglycan LD-endopeptidase LytH